MGSSGKSELRNASQRHSLARIHQNRIRRHHVDIRSQNSKKDLVPADSD